MSHRNLVKLFPSIALALLLVVPGVALAVGSGPAPAPVAPRSAEAEYNAGLQAKAAGRFSAAVTSFRRAAELDQAIRAGR